MSRRGLDFNGPHLFAAAFQAMAAPAVPGTRLRKAPCSSYTPSSGLIAGESLMGIVIALLVVAGVITK